MTAGLTGTRRAGFAALVERQAVAWLIVGVAVVVMGCVAEETASAPVPGNYRLERVLASDTLDLALAFAVIPGEDEKGVVATQDGVMYRVSLSEDSPVTVFGDASSVIGKDLAPEEGFFGLAFSPNYEIDRHVYLYYLAEDSRSVVSRAVVVDGSVDMGTEVIILEVPQPHHVHAGGQIAFGPDGYLYVSLGDGGPQGDPEGHSQNLSLLWGSILRLDVGGDEGYEAPPDNPFVGVDGARPEIYAYGFREPWRFSFDRASGDLWAADVGHLEWEEVNRVVAGGNYGWNVLEGLECFRSLNCDRRGLQMPLLIYGRDEGCAVIGGYVYRGQAMPELDGWYIYSDLCSGQIWAVNGSDDSLPVVLAEMVEEDVLITSFGELADGELLVLTMGNGVYRLEGRSN